MSKAIELQKLPTWAKEMSNKEWQSQTQKAKAYTNCATCGERLIITLCKYDEPKLFCVEHCPEHKWQSDYDWQTECARCGIPYVKYLERLLVQHKISFKRVG